MSQAPTQDIPGDSRICTKCSNILPTRPSFESITGGSALSMECRDCQRARIIPVRGKRKRVVTRKIIDNESHSQAASRAVQSVAKQRGKKAAAREKQAAARGRLDIRRAKIAGPSNSGDTVEAIEIAKKVKKANKAKEAKAGKAIKASRIVRGAR